MIVGRRKEMENLRGSYSSDDAEFVALCGRRGVGKTYLVSELFEGKTTFSHVGISPVDPSVTGKSRMKVQLNHFYASLVSQGMAESGPPGDWLQAFRMLESLLQSKADGSRQLVFLDEIQWMDTPRSQFITGLESFWNGWVSLGHPIMLIVCGSSTSWIFNKLIDNCGGLYGRVTSLMCLSSFDLAETEEFLRSNGVGFSRYDIARTYMALGGIPYHLKQIDRGMSVERNLERLFFDRKAPLGSEFDALFQSAFSSPGPMETIVRALGRTRMGLTRQEIIEETRIPDGGVLTSYLDSLMKEDLVARYTPFGEGRRGSRYRLIDPFCRFYLHFVDQGRSGGDNPVLSDAVLASWMGSSFEDVCLEHIGQIKQALGIAGVSTRESPWYERDDECCSGTQICTIIERKDRVVDVCEAEFVSGEFVVDKSRHLSLVRRKELIGEVVSKRTAVRNVLICTDGLEKNEYRWDFAALVTLDDLFVRRSRGCRSSYVAGGRRPGRLLLSVAVAVILGAFSSRSTCGSEATGCHSWSSL